jgi:uncharacterized membrane protein YkvA (DUF1232 family)
LLRAQPVRGIGAVVTGLWWADLLLGVAAALVLCWLALVAVLLTTRPPGNLISEALRLLPDVLRLIRRLAADPTVPRGVRIRLGLLLVYLAAPIDLVPDFIPILGHADDAIITVVVLRGVVRRAGPDALSRQWPGTPDGLAALHRLVGLPTPPPDSETPPPPAR